MRIGIYANTKRDLLGQSANKFIELLVSRDIEFKVCDVLAQFVKCPVYTLQEIILTVDILVVFGGDGTMLNVARQASIQKLPILGINNGYLGFLTEADNSEIEQVLDRLIAGEYSVDSRCMLDVACNGEVYKAINEASLVRWNSQRTINVMLEVDSKLADVVTGDGVLVCTATGSTAYSLSCGGAILSPQLKAFGVTAISPHSLHSRPIVIGDESIVTLYGSSDKGDRLALTVDGNVQVIKQDNLNVVIKKAEENALFVRLKDENFYSRLIKKFSGCNKIIQMEKELCLEGIDN